MNYFSLARWHSKLIKLSYDSFVIFKHKSKVTLIGVNYKLRDLDWIGVSIKKGACDRKSPKVED